MYVCMYVCPLLHFSPFFKKKIRKEYYPYYEFLLKQIKPIFFLTLFPSLLAKSIFFYSKQKSVFFIPTIDFIYFDLTQHCIFITLCITNFSLVSNINMPLTPLGVEIGQARPGFPLNRPGLNCSSLA